MEVVFDPGPPHQPFGRFTVLAGEEGVVPRARRLVLVAPTQVDSEDIVPTVPESVVDAVQFDLTHGDSEVMC